MKIIFLLLILLYCTYTDIRQRRIYNKVLLTGLMIAFLVNFYELGVSGIFITFKGLFVGILIFILPYYLGWLGAGDAKLVGLIGAFTGWEFAMYDALIIAVTGGLISSLLLIKDKKIGPFLKSLFLFMFTRSFVYLREEDTKYSFPYAIAILMGTCITLGLEMIGYV